MNSEIHQSIENLKQLFYEHFRVERSNFETNDCNELLKDSKLEFNELNQILQKWIKRLNIEQENLGSKLNNTNNNNKSSEKSFNFDELKDTAVIKPEFMSDYLRVLKLTNKRTRLSINKEISQKTKNSEESYSSSSSSIPSLSLSDESLFKQNSNNSILTNSFTNFDHLDNNKNNSILNGELEAENRQLKQIILDLKTQLINAEDLNSQLAFESEQKNDQILSVKRINEDLSIKLKSINDDNENFRRQIEQHKYRVESLICENKDLKIDLRCYQQELTTKENDLFESNTHFQTTNFNLEEVKNELNELKVSCFGCFTLV